MWFVLNLRLVVMKLNIYQAKKQRRTNHGQMIEMSALYIWLLIASQSIYYGTALNKFRLE